MSDRRPPQRPTNSAARRPAPARPAASRPTGGSGPRRSPQRGKKRASGRFFIFLAILLVALIAVALIVWKPWVSATPDTSAQPAAAQATAAPADGAAAADPTVPAEGTALSALLGDNDAVVAGLSDDQLVQVDDLSINTNLSTEWKNVLLLGTDQRQQGASCRSDTMIICSINVNTGEVKLTSLMRDIAVNLEGIGQWEQYNPFRLNAANYFGGPELTMKTINELLDMNIENYVMVSFSGFTQVAEALGGVEMSITEEEMKMINYNARIQATIAAKYGWDESNITQTNVELTEYGENVHLNGRQALAYARIRKIDSDWERTNRQRKVLMALMDKLKGKNAMELMQAALPLQQYVETNMDFNEIISIAVTVVNSDLSQVETQTLPVEKTYVQETRNNQSMFYDVDWETNTRQLQNFIYY